jgi:hypothetical protein
MLHSNQAMNRQDMISSECLLTSFFLLQNKKSFFIAQQNSGKIIAKSSSLSIVKSDCHYS